MHDLEADSMNIVLAMLGLTNTLLNFLQVSTEKRPLLKPVKPKQPMVDPTLLERARSFLSSSDIKSADESEKRRFLTSKGLSSSELDQLLLQESTPEHSEQVCNTRILASLPVLIVAAFTPPAAP